MFVFYCIVNNSLTNTVGYVCILCGFLSYSYVFLFRVSCISYDCMQDTTENQQYSAK